mmetsp:Transcript_96748/g.208769  ORF Transcript_96748/g.208769 Transcript_96748/m.208769 type:complete len:451 (+) Transcript_96748:1-1353(+)
MHAPLRARPGSGEAEDTLLLDAGVDDARAVEHLHLPGLAFGQLAHLHGDEVLRLPACPERVHRPELRTEPHAGEQRVQVECPVVELPDVGVLLVVLELGLGTVVHHPTLLLQETRVVRVLHQRPEILGNLLVEEAVPHLVELLLGLLERAGVLALDRRGELLEGLQSLLAVGGLLDLALLRAEGRDGREAPVLPRLALRGLVGRDGLLGGLVRPRQVPLRPPHLRDGVEHVALLFPGPAHLLPERHGVRERPVHAVLLAGRQRSVEHQRLRGRGDGRRGLAERGVGVRDHLEHLRLPLGLPGLLQPRQLLLGLPEASLGVVLQRARPDEHLQARGQAACLARLRPEDLQRLLGAGQRRLAVRRPRAEQPAPGCEEATLVGLAAAGAGLAQGLLDQPARLAELVVVHACGCLHKGVHSKPGLLRTAVAAGFPDVLHGHGRRAARRGQTPHS